MTTVQIRQKLHQYIDVAQDKKLEAIYNLIEDELIENKEENYEEWKIKMIDERIRLDDANPNNGTDWEILKKKYFR